MKTINPADGGGWVPLTNKFNATCHNCQEEIDQGENILWKKGVGVKHMECEKKEINLEESMPEKKLVITEKEWVDFQQYSHDVLMRKTECQCCGKSLGDPDKVNKWWINVEKRTCEKCFLA